VTATSAASRTQPSMRVLIVEDDDDWRDTLDEYLELLGCESYAFANAEDALRLAAEVPPGLALIDLGLQDTDGYEVVRRLRAVPGCSATRVVALTGFGDSATRACAASAGFDDFLVKPLVAGKLEALLRSLAPRG
jgi:DNA-binding response OmpR family regulator